MEINSVVELTTQHAGGSPGLVLIHAIFAVIKACLSAAIAALMAGVSLVITVVVLGGILAFAVAGMFGLGGSRFAARRREKRDGDA